MNSSLVDILKAAAIYTIPLSFVSFFLGMILALAVASARIYSIGPIRLLCRLYCAIIRGTPLLIQLFIIFYALPRIGIVIEPIPSAIIGLSLHVGAYAAEIIRASLLSVPRVLHEAGLSIGFTRRQVFWQVLVPHAAFSATPPLFNTFIDLVKATSLASIILVPEIMRKAQEYAISSNSFLTVYIQAACVYLIICLFLEYMQRLLEKHVTLEKES